MGGNVWVVVAYDASVYEVALDTRTEVKGILDVWFARAGCGWRLVAFEY